MDRRDLTVPKGTMIRVAVTLPPSLRSDEAAVIWLAYGNTTLQQAVDQIERDLLSQLAPQLPFEVET